VAPHVKPYLICNKVLHKLAQVAIFNMSVAVLAGMILGPVSLLALSHYMGFWSHHFYYCSLVFAIGSFLGNCYADY